MPGPLRLALLQLGDATLRRLLGETARKEEVARVATRHRDDIAAEPDLLDVAAGE